MALGSKRRRYASKGLHFKVCIACGWLKNNTAAYHAAIEHVTSVHGDSGSSPARIVVVVSKNEKGTAQSLKSSIFIEVMRPFQNGKILPPAALAMVKVWGIIIPEISR